MACDGLCDFVWLVTGCVVLCGFEFEASVNIGSTCVHGSSQCLFSDLNYFTPSSLRQIKQCVPSITKKLKL